MTKKLRLVKVYNI